MALPGPERTRAAASHEYGRRLRPARDVELLESIAEIVLDRLVAQRERVGDFLVGLALDDQAENALLLRREVVHALHGPSHPPRELRIKDRLAGRRVADGRK